MAIERWQSGNWYFQLNPATGAGHASRNAGQFEPAFEPTAQSVTMDTITHPMVTETYPVTTIPIAPDVFIRKMESAADMLRSISVSVHGADLARWLEEMADSVDVDPFAPNYVALAAEEPTSQYQDAVDAAEYPRF